MDPAVVEGLALERLLVPVHVCKVLAQGLPGRLSVAHLSDDIAGGLPVSADGWASDGLLQAIVLDLELAQHLGQGLRTLGVGLQFPADPLPVAARFAARLQVQEKGVLHVGGHPAGQCVKWEGGILFRLAAGGQEQGSQRQHPHKPSDPPHAQLSLRAMRII